MSIVTYNTWNRTLECIRSIQSSPQSCAFEILVCDNGSEAPPSELPAGVILTAHGVNHGFGAGHNINLSRARFDHMLILNPDTTLGPGVLGGLRDALAEHELIAIAPLLVTADGTPQTSLRRLPDTASEFGRLVGLDRRPGSRFSTLLESPPRGTEVRVVPQPPGAALMVRTAVLRERGGFDERYPLYFEDVDLCRRLGELGTVAVTPRIVVIHDGEGTARHYRTQTTFWIENSRWRYHASTGRGARRIVTRALVAMSIASRALVWGAGGVVSPGARAKAAGYALAFAAIFRGTEAYWRERMLR